jgi:hypothetical protein
LPGAGGERLVHVLDSAPLVREQRQRRAVRAAEDRGRA